MWGKLLKRKGINLDEDDHDGNNNHKNDNEQEVPNSYFAKQSGLNASKNTVLKFMDDILPQILNSKSFWNTLLTELKHHHRWVAVIFFYSEKFPRVLRVLSLSTNITVMLFIQSLTYDLVNGDDGSCESFTTKTSCLEPRSAYATGTEKCAWSSTDESCSYIQPDNAIEVVLFVAIFSALISTPVTFMVDWLLLHILAAPTVPDTEPKFAEWRASVFKNWNGTPKIIPTAENHHAPHHDPEMDQQLSPVDAGIPQFPHTPPEQQTPHKRFTHHINQIVPKLMTVHRQISRTKSIIYRNDDEREQQANVELDEMRDAITVYRKNKFGAIANQSFFHTHTVTHEQHEFDKLWGIDSNSGDFKNIPIAAVSSSVAVAASSSNHSSSISSLCYTCITGHKSTVNIADIIVVQLRQLIHDYEVEADNFKTVFVTDKQKNKRLLYLFYKDLLPGIKGQILEYKDQRDNGIVKYGVPYSRKVMAWIFLLALNIGTLFYVLLFALSQTTHRQNAWSRSFGLWLMTEIVVISTFMCIINHIVIPSFLMKDVRNIQQKIIDCISSLYSKIPLFHGASTGNPPVQQPENNVNNEDGDEDGDANGQQVEKLVLYENGDEALVDLEQQPNDPTTQSNNDMTAVYTAENDPNAFNAAKYFYLSYRMAKRYPDLPISKVVLHFSTPWPKQSYQKIENVSKGYAGRFTPIVRSITFVVLYFLTQVLTIPQSIQDMLIHMISTVTMGYLVLGHIQLYVIAPALVILPTLLLLVIVSLIVLGYRWYKLRPAAVVVDQSNPTTTEVQPQTIQNNTIPVKNAEPTAINRPPSAVARPLPPSVLVQDDHESMQRISYSNFLSNDILNNRNNNL